MAFPSAFTTLAAAPYGEALVPHFYVRLNDGTDGAPSTLVDLSTNGAVLSLNPVKRQRELKFGVIQGQSWVVRVTNPDLSLLDYDFVGCNAAVYGAFEGAELEAVFAQGRIDQVSPSIDGTVSFEIHDSVMDLLRFTIPREMGFQNTGWLSPMRTVAKASGSGTYSTTQPLTLNTEADAIDETFIVEFSGSSVFRVILEDGDGTQEGNTESDLNVTNVGNSTGIVTIPAAGWRGTYSAGDQFVFYTSKARTALELTPINMVEHLIDDISGVSVFDVLAGGGIGNVVGVRP